MTKEYGDGIGLNLEDVPEGFTVIGIYENTYQRFAEHYPIARTWEEAQEIARLQNPELIVAGIIPGEHTCLDTEDWVK